MDTTLFLSPDDTTFDAQVLQQEGTVLVDFWAPWCGPCTATKPVVEHVGQGRDGLGVAFVNVDDNPGLVERFGVRSIPALKLFRDGKVVAEATGAQNKAQLEAWLTEHGA